MADETNRTELQRPNQHEDLIERVTKGFKAVLDAVEKGGTGAGSTVVIQLDTAVQEQILGVLRQVLGIVKDIRKNQGEAGGVTDEQLHAALGPAVEGLKEIK